MKKIIAVAFMLGCASLFSQEKGFIEQNYIEVSGRAEKELSPDEIYLDITITEKDNRGKVSIERQEKSLFKRLASIGIDLTKDLQISDISSSLEKFFLKKNAILLTKSYVLKVNGTSQLTALFEQLEQEGITDVKITRTALSNFEQVKKEKRRKKLFFKCKEKRRGYCRRSGQNSWQGTIHSKLCKLPSFIQSKHSCQDDG